MPKVGVYDEVGNRVGEMELKESIFGAEINKTLMHEAVLSYLAGRRRGTAKTKTRGEVRGGGRKPWRQKGTGRARAGSIRSPLWRHGGVVFGPVPREYGYKLPKKARRAALKSALTARMQDGDVIVVRSLALEQPKTREMVKVLNSLGAGEDALIVLPERDEGIERSARNLPAVTVMLAKDLNTYEVLNH
ncbi:MAG: 50S ribosomal protein L4, partial [Clostridia bacterium]|nr:50S ribosomal protein L4 [Clostridia bacterium]